MGTLGRIATGSRGQVAYAEEATWGQPVAPDQRVSFVTESLNNEQGNLVSGAINPSRGISKQVRGTSAIGGDVAFECNTEGYEVWYKHALGDAISMQKVDGGVRTQVRVEYTSGTALEVNATVGFSATVDWDLIAVYKDATTGLLTSTNILLTAIADGDTFTVTAIGSTIPVGAWIFQRYTGAGVFWDTVYTHYIEAAKDLPVGMSIEAGRDVAFFEYSGMRVNTLENTFAAQELLTGTASFLGKAEYSGGDLDAQAAIAAVSIAVKNVGLDYASASQAVGFAFADDGGVFTDESTAANNDTTNDMTITSATPVVVGDAYYFGATSPFSALQLKLSTQGVGTWTIAWQYYNGTSWVALTFTQQEIAHFMEPIGTYVNTWTMPADWASTTVNAQAAYWIRARVATWSVTTFAPKGERAYLGPSVVGFKSAGVLQIGDENGVTYTGYTYDTATSLMTITGIPASGAASIQYAHAENEPVGTQVAWDTPADPPATDMLTSFQAGMYLDGAWLEVMSGNWTINNNLNADKYQMGSRTRAGLPEQQRTVEGLIHVEFDNLILYHKFINGTAAFLEVRAIDDTEVISGVGTPAGSEVYRQMHVLFPNIKYTGTTPQIGGPEMIEHDMNFTALQDTTNNMNEMAVIFVNTINRGF